MTRSETGSKNKKLAMEKPVLWSPEFHLSSTVRDMPPSGIRKFFDIVVGMEDVISLGVGEPDFPTPWHIREACIYSLECGHTSYTSNKGLIELREILAESTKEELDLDYDPEEEILITTGVSEAVDLAFRATLNPGDEVIVPQPCYVAYVPDVLLAGGVPKPVATRLSEEFKLRPEDFRDAIGERTKALVLSYPNNPTGAIMTREDLEEIADLVVENDLLVISDEVYGKLTYDGDHASFAQLEGMRGRTVVLNGLSKSCAMTGWRIGYAIGDPAIIGAMTKVHQYTMLCAPTDGPGGGGGGFPAGRLRGEGDEAGVRPAAEALRLGARTARPPLLRAEGGLLRLPLHRGDGAHLRGVRRAALEGAEGSGRPRKRLRRERRGLPPLLLRHLQGGDPGGGGQDRAVPGGPERMSQGLKRV